jgi:hypothetical protein
MLKSKQFWVGVLIGYLVVVFVPQVNFRQHMQGGSGNAG